MKNKKSILLLATVLSAGLTMSAAYACASCSGYSGAYSVAPVAATNYKTCDDLSYGLTTACDGDGSDSCSSCQSTSQSCDYCPVEDDTCPGGCNGGVAY